MSGNRQSAKKSWERHLTWGRVIGDSKKEHSDLKGTSNVAASALRPEKPLRHRGSDWKKIKRGGGCLGPILLVSWKGSSSLGQKQVRKGVVDYKWRTPGKKGLGKRRRDTFFLSSRIREGLVTIAIKGMEGSFAG